MGRVRELPLRGLLRVIVAEDSERVMRIRSDASEEAVDVVDAGVVVVVVDVAGSVDF